MDVAIEAHPLDPGRREIEVVERKGIGHPDTLCDRVAEAFCHALCRFYLEETGSLHHHNVDKALLSAGRTRVTRGGGEWLAPITFVLGGQATTRIGEIEVPLDSLAAAAVREAISPVRCLPVEQVRQEVLAHGGSAELVSLFGASPGAVPRANDTSIGVGFAPLTLTEDLVLAVERKLNAAETKAQHPAIGEDIKVLAVRRGRLIQITVAAAMISRYIDSAGAYRDAVEAVRQVALDAVRERLATAAAGAGDGRRPRTVEGVELVVNAADDPSGAEYLTLSGTSAESGDDGQVGRGNRLSGLITPMRPMTLEAASGKNPRTHVGRIYSQVAGAIARACTGLEGVRGAECLLVSRIGGPIHEPWMASVRLDYPSPLPRQTAIEVSRLVHDELQKLTDPGSHLRRIPCRSRG